jgi:hypothetical protein
LSQNSATNQYVQNLNLQHTQLTDELIYQFEKERLLSLGGRGIVSGDLSSKNKTQSSNMMGSG